MGVFLLRQTAGLGFGLPVILVTIKLLEGLEVGQHEGRAPASGEQDEGARAPGEPERGEGVSRGAELRLPEAGMSLLRLPESVIDAFQLWVRLELGEGPVERGAVAFVLPVGHILGQFVRVRHQSPRKAQGSSSLGLPGFGPQARVGAVRPVRVDKRAGAPMLEPPAYYNRDL